MTFDEEQLRELADIVEFIREQGGEVQKIKPTHQQTGGPFSQALGVTEPVIDLRIHLPEVQYREEPEEEPQDIELE